MDEVGRGRDGEKNVKTSVEWVAFKQQFFCAILVADSTFENAYMTQTTDKSNTNANYLCDMNSTIGLTYSSERDCTMGMNFYFIDPDKTVQFTHFLQKTEFLSVAIVPIERHLGHTQTAHSIPSARFFPT